MASRQLKIPKIDLILVELGSEWPTWLNQKLAGATRRVLCQTEGEKPGEFVKRVLGTLAGERFCLCSATLLCNERADSEQATARAELARALGDSRSPNQASKLVFAAPERALSASC